MQDTELNTFMLICLLHTHALVSWSPRHLIYFDLSLAHYYKESENILQFSVI